MADKWKYVEIPQPYHLPGYTGLCPDVQYRLGKGFSLATHLAICDPKVFHAEKLVLSRDVIQDLNEYHGATRQMSAVNIRKKLEQELMLSKSTRRPRHLEDLMSTYCYHVPLVPVTVVCKGYNSSIPRSQ